ncbi:MAG: hypothetical protein NTV86_22535, partial [Planctomycetota bacterium]|nr:hypothetical protein [Planctomycetota bacterium]
KALNRTTEFFVSANRAQQEAIGADLTRGREGTPLGKKEATGKPKGKDRSGLGQISERRADEEKALRTLTDQLEKDSKSQVARQQADLSDKLSQLQENRYARGLGVAAKADARRVQPPRVGDMGVYGGGIGAGGNDDFGMPGGGSGGGGEGGYFAGEGSGQAAAPAAPPPGGPANRPAAEPRAGDTKEYGLEDVGSPGGAVRAGAAAAMGTFSLPIDLPDIGIRKDFTSPGGEGTVTIWAFQDRPLAAARSTTGILTGLLLLQCLLWIARSVRKLRPPAGAWRRGLCYALLAVGGWVLWGATAAVPVTLLAAALTEAARYIPRRQTP